MVPPAKRRKTESKVEEINFDLSARQEFLTGFHKRKVQRTKQAQEAAEKKAREERIAERKRIREERKQDLERHVREVNALMQPADAEEEDADEEEIVPEWDGLEDPELPPIDHEAEYIDEDKYTTVTVETMDISREGLSKLAQSSDESAEEDDSSNKTRPTKTDTKPKNSKSATDKQRTLQSKLLKRKKKNFRYESKTDRKVSRMKEKLKNRKSAKARKSG